MGKTVHTHWELCCKLWYERASLSSVRHERQDFRTCFELLHYLCWRSRLCSAQSSHKYAPAYYVFLTLIILGEGILFSLTLEGLSKVGEGLSTKVMFLEKNYFLYKSTVTDLFDEDLPTINNQKCLTINFVFVSVFRKVHHVLAGDQKYTNFRFGGSLSTQLVWGVTFNPHRNHDVDVNNEKVAKIADHFIRFNKLIGIYTYSSVVETFSNCMKKLTYTPLLKTIKSTGMKVFSNFGQLFRYSEVVFAQFLCTYTSL